MGTANHLPDQQRTAAVHRRERDNQWQQHDREVTEKELRDQRRAPAVTYAFRNGLAD